MALLLSPLLFVYFDKDYFTNLISASLGTFDRSICLSFVFVTEWRCSKSLKLHSHTDILANFCWRKEKEFMVWWPMLVFESLKILCMLKNFRRSIQHACSCQQELTSAYFHYPQLHLLPSQDWTPAVRLEAPLWGHLSSSRPGVGPAACGEMASTVEWSHYMFVQQQCQAPVGQSYKVLHLHWQTFKICLQSARGPSVNIVPYQHYVSAHFR